MSENMLNETEVAELNDRFVNAIRNSYANYNEHGARSDRKLRPLHQWVADEMQSALGEGYVLQGLRESGEGGEETIAGKYYDKKVDVTIAKEGGDPLAIISVKFITSNFKQNANNYFEHLMGETANIRRRDIVVGHLMALPNELPYLNKDNEIVRRETITTTHLRKYVELARDESYPHRPDAIAISVVSLPMDNLADHRRIKLMDLEAMDVSGDIKDALAGEFSLPHFICTMKNLVRKKK